MESSFAMCNTLVAKPGMRDQLEAMLIAGSTAEPMDGCELYVITRSEEDPDALVVLELWRDAEAHAASLELPRVRAAIGTAMSFVSHVEGQKLRPVAGLGVR
jgi:quinol monooxygenase YgiN